MKLKTILLATSFFTVAGFTGAQARVQLRLPIGGQRKFVGVLRGVADGAVLLDVDGELKRFALADLERARLVPQL